MHNWEKHYGSVESENDSITLDSVNTLYTVVENETTPLLIKKNDKHFEFDHFLTTYLSDLGPYQIFVICLLIIPGCFLSAYSTMDIVFLSYTPSHKCKIEDSIANQTTEITQCTYKLITDNNDSLSIKCQNWTYDNRYFDQTLVTQWDLVCDKALIIRTIVSMMNLATIFSALYTIVQDKYGRKKAFMLNLSIYLLGSCCSVWSTNPAVFGVAKFVAGISCLWNICYCWALEFVGPSKRSLVAVLLSFLYACANLSLVILAYVCSTWRQLAFLTSFPFILLFSYACFLPESPRWLLTQGRTGESFEIFRKMASWQGVSNTDDMNKRLASFASSTSTKSSFKIDHFGVNDFFKSKNLLLKNALLTLASVLTNQLYTAVPFNVENMGTENYYVTYMLQAAVEPPAILINLLFLNRIGRVLPLGTSMIASGVFCMLTWPLQNGPSWALTLTTMVSRFLICTGVPVTQQLANELYPTVARGTGNSVTLVVGAMVSVTTQYVLYTSTVWKPLPMIIMGSTTILGGVAVLFLPETKDCPLPDTVEDAERQGSVGWMAFTNHFRKLDR